MPLLGTPGSSIGFIPPFTILPPTGPTGVLPARTLGDQGGLPPVIPIQSTGVMPPAEVLPDRGLPVLGRVGQAAAARTRSFVFPPTETGQGFLSRTRRQVNQMDLINGMDRTLGKDGPNIAVSARRQQGMKIIGKLTTREALGAFSGRLGRMYI